MLTLQTTWLWKNAFPTIEVSKCTENVELNWQICLLPLIVNPTHTHTHTHTHTNTHKHTHTHTVHTYTHAHNRKHTYTHARIQKRRKEGKIECLHFNQRRISFLSIANSSLYALSWRQHYKISLVCKSLS